MNKKEYNKQYYQLHRDKYLTRSKNYYKTHTDIMKKRSKKWYYDHRKENLIKARIYAKKHYQQKKKYMLTYYRKRWRKIRNEIYDLLGKKCVRCGFDDERALQVDHLNNDGYLLRKTITNTLSFLKHIKKTPQKYQILCANCNWIKRVETDEKRFKEKKEKHLTAQKTT